LSAETINEIVQFWLGSALDGPEIAYARRDWWYNGGAAVDDEIRDRFGTIVPRACRRELMDWRETPNGAFALILLLDQFTRNLYRNSPDAYLGDASAFEVVNHAIGNKLDLDLHPVCRIWLYHPFHHAESLEEQERGGVLLQQVRASASSEWHRYIDRSIRGWRRHRDIVARFGRFPHRNAVLGRISTADECAFLAENGENFGQGPKPE
jgi:uncharacterized protein (DUF924 family)